MSKHTPVAVTLGTALAATALQLLSPGDYVEHVRAALPILREP